MPSSSSCVCSSSLGSSLLLHAARPIHITNVSRPKVHDFNVFIVVVFYLVSTKSIHPVGDDSLYKSSDSAACLQHKEDEAAGER